MFFPSTISLELHFPSKVTENGDESSSTLRSDESLKCVWEVITELGLLPWFIRYDLENETNEPLGIQFSRTKEIIQIKKRIIRKNSNYTTKSLAMTIRTLWKYLKNYSQDPSPFQ